MWSGNEALDKSGDIRDGPVCVCVFVLATTKSMTFLHTCNDRGIVYSSVLENRNAGA